MKPIESTVTLPNNLPRQEHEFIGRSEALNRLLKLLSRTSRYWLISIVGPGGIGKSALALEASLRCMTRTNLPIDVDATNLAFDGFIWTSAKSKYFLNGTVNPSYAVHSNLEAIVAEIINVLAPAFRAKPTADQRAQVIHLLGTKRILLIVDNLEAVNDPNVLAFLKDLPSPSKAIITDRRQIHESASIALGDLEQKEANELVQVRCEQETNHLLKLNEEQIKMIVSRTGGIPLAIHLVIGQILLGHGSPETILGRIKGDDSALLMFLFDDSYVNVSETARKILQRLSLLNSPTAGQILALGLGNDAAENGIIELLESGLLSEQRDINADTSAVCGLMDRRYRLLPLLRDYVLPRAPRKHWIALRKELCDAIYDQLQSIETNFEWPSTSTIQFVDDNIDSLLWAYEDAMERKDYGKVPELLFMMAFSLDMRGRYSLWMRLSELAKKAATVLRSRETESRICIKNTGWIYFKWHSFDDAEREVSSGLSKLQSDNALLQAIGKRLLGLIAKERGNLGQALSLLEQAHADFVRLNDRRWLAINFGALGSLERDSGDYQKAEAHYRSALEILQTLDGVEHLIETICEKMSGLMIRMNRLVDAESFNHNALQILQKLKRQCGVAHCKLNLARIAERRGDIPEAANLVKEAADLFKAFGAPQEARLDLDRIFTKLNTAPPTPA
jgi:tetratricopeptide (TPR) repeat protein